MKPLYQAIALTLAAIETCKKTGNTGWREKHEARLELLVSGSMPRGSGIDSGTKIDILRSTPEKLVFYVAYHHMDQNGYDGWTEYTLFVTPSLCSGIDLRFVGRDRNDTKSYLYEIYREALTQVVDEYA